MCDSLFIKTLTTGQGPFWVQIVIRYHAALCFFYHYLYSILSNLKWFKLISLGWI